MACSRPTDAATHVLEAARRRGPTLGGGRRVVTVDGPAGAGKSTLAAGVARLAAAQGQHVEVVHMDDLYDGWRGLFSVSAQVAALLGSLHQTGSAAYRRYDWHRGEYAEERRLRAPDLLVLEGVGCSAPEHDHLVTLRVWVGAPRELRLHRGLARDGEHLRGQWLRFLDDEKVLHARDRTRERADVVVDGSSGEVTRRAPDPHARR